MFLDGNLIFFRLLIFIYKYNFVEYMFNSRPLSNTNRKRFASSMNGRFWPSVSSFHSAPNRFEISELCIFGLSWAILRRWPRDHTINAFMGLLMCSTVNLMLCTDILCDVVKCVFLMRGPFCVMKEIWVIMVYFIRFAEHSEF